MTPAAELDWHLRRHGLGTIGDGGISFDWDRLAERQLVLVPIYEPDSRPIYESVRSRLPEAAFWYAEAAPCPVPDPAIDDFFVAVESRIASTASRDGELVYINFFTEEAYLATTARAARTVFDERAFDLLARAFARCAMDESLRMRRHRHGVRIFRDAFLHMGRLDPPADLPSSVLL